MTTYSEKTFHLDFEKSHGYLTPDQFPPIDWSDKKQIEMLFPAYRREQLRFDAMGGQRSKAVEIDGFNLKTPDGTVPSPLTIGRPFRQHQAPD
jgi:hypothetical protein